MKSSTKAKKTNAFKKQAIVWYKENYTITCSNRENGFVHTPDEVFVQVYNYKKMSYVNYHIISQYGNILSFVNPEKPILLAQTNNKGYLCCLEGLYVHRLVWFSFAKQALDDRSIIPFHYNISINTTSELRNVAKQSNLYVIHHIDRNPLNNNLSNLLMAPWDTHEMLHKLYAEKNILKRLDLLSISSSLNDASPTIITIGNDVLSLKTVTNNTIMENINSLNMHISSYMTLTNLIHTVLKTTDYFEDMDKLNIAIISKQQPMLFKAKLLGQTWEFSPYDGIGGSFNIIYDSDQDTIYIPKS